LNFANEEQERKTFLLLLLEDLDRVPLLIRWLLLVIERTFEIHLGQEVIGIKFEEAGE
jgi:hypothetical protein